MEQTTPKDKTPAELLAEKEYPECNYRDMGQSINAARAGFAKGFSAGQAARPAHPSQTEDEHPGYRAVLIAALKMETPDIERLIKDCSMVVPKPLSAPKAVETVPCPHLVNGSCPLHNLHCQYPKCTNPRTR